MNFSRRKIFIDSLIYTILPKVSFVASLMILPWITPYLTLNDYGIYGLLMAYVTVFQIVMVLGQNVLLQNTFFTYRTNYKLVWKRAFAIMTLAGIVCCFMFCLIVYFTFLDKLGDNFLPILIMISIYFILSPIDTIVVNYYVLHEKSLPYAYGAALSGLITTLITLITIRYLKFGYLGWVISLPSGALISYVYYFRRIFLKEKIYPEFRLKGRFIVKALKVGLPLTPHQLSLYILGISDRLLLEYFNIPIKQIGFYSQGYNIGSQGNIIVNGIFQAFSKKLQEGFRGNDDVHRIFIKRIIIIIPVTISIILFIGSLWAKEAFLFLFRNPELQNAYPVSIIVLSSYMFWSLYSFFSYPLSIKNQTFAISKITLIAASFNIVGNIVLIPYYGIWASLGVTYVSYVIFGFAGLFNKENRLFLNTYINIFNTCIYLFLINLTLFITSFLSKDLNWGLKLVLSLLVTSLIVGALKKYKL